MNSRPMKPTFSLTLAFCWLSLTAFAGSACGQAEDMAARIQSMQLTSRAFRQATQEVEKSLVTIASFGGVGTTAGKIGGIRDQGKGNSTGIMISEDGYILTSTFNFVDRPLSVFVIAADGRKQLARIIGRDDTRKICLLKVDGEGYEAGQVAKLDEVKIGQWAMSMGVGFGDSTPAISMGIISATNRIGGLAVQTDANISPACYGGPLIDIYGKIIGVCVPMNPQSRAISAGVDWYDSGIGFAVPLDGLAKVIERMKKGEEIAPGFVGIGVTPNPTGDGLYINKIAKASAAEKAGLKVKDIVLKINEEVVNDVLTFRRQVNRFESGSLVTMLVQKILEPEAKPKTGSDGDKPKVAPRKNPRIKRSKPVEVKLKLQAPPRPTSALDEFRASLEG